MLSVKKSRYSTISIMVIFSIILIGITSIASTNALTVGPSPPTNLIAKAVSTSEIDLSWTAPSDLNSLILDGYKIERSTDGGTTWSTIVSSTGSTATTYSDTGLAASTTYTYRVSSVNSFGASSPSNIASAKTFDVVPPIAPTGLTATAVSSSQINLSWTAPTNNGGSAITGYKIERSTDGGTTWSTIVSNTGSTGTTYSDTGLVHSTTYTYRVSAINSAGTSSPSDTASDKTFDVVPTAPTGLTATAVSSSQINLSWAAPVDDGGLPITGYMIERSTDGG